MSESAPLPMNFGGISEEKYSNYQNARVIIFPVSDEGTNSSGGGAMAIIDASRRLELYEEETDTEVHQIGINTLNALNPSEIPGKLTESIYQKSKDLIATSKFICLVGGDHSASDSSICAHAEKFHNLSVLRIGARARMPGHDESSPAAGTSFMTNFIKEMRIPSVQVGIRSISADAIRRRDDFPTRIFWVQENLGQTFWMDEAINSLTENVYLNIDISGLDPSLVPTAGHPEPGGLGWYETLAFLRKLAERRRVVGMDLVEFCPTERSFAAAFLCAKLIYKTLAYIFQDDPPKVRKS